MSTEPTSSRTTFYFSLAAGVAAVIAGLFALRDDFTRRIEDAAYEQQEATRKLAQKITALEAQVATVAARPVTDAATTDGLRTDLNTAEEKINLLTARLEALEKTPPAAPVAAAPPSPATPPAAVPSAPEAPAAAPVLNPDAVLRNELRAILARVMVAPPAAAENGSLVNRLNAHFGRLISIRRKSSVPPEYVALSAEAAHADLPTLIAHVAALPAPLQAPFAAWLESARHGGGAQ